MGNAQASSRRTRPDPEWLLKNTIAGGGKYTSLNGWKTRVPGLKPILVRPNANMSEWVVLPKTVISGRPLRSVRSEELGTAAVLLESFGSCLVTYQETPLGSALPVTCTTASLAELCRYLSLSHADEKQDRIRLVVVVPTGGRRFTTNSCPELEYVGEDVSGQPVVAFRPSSCARTRKNSSSKSLSLGTTGKIRSLVQTHAEDQGGRMREAFRSTTWTAQ